MYAIYKNTLFYFFNLQKKQKEQVNFIFYLFFCLKNTVILHLYNFEFKEIQNLEENKMRKIEIQK